MLGLETQDAALRTASSHRALGEAFIGLRALQRGRLCEAASWLSRCVALGETANIDDYWARVQLSNWATRRHSMKWIERQAARKRAGATAADASGVRPVGGGLRSEG